MRSTGLVAIFCQSGKPHPRSRTWVPCCQWISWLHGIVITTTMAQSRDRMGKRILGGLEPPEYNTPTNTGLKGWMVSHPGIAVMYKITLMRCKRNDEPTGFEPAKSQDVDLTSTLTILLTTLHSSNLEHSRDTLMALLCYTTMSRSADLNLSISFPCCAQPENASLENNSILSCSP